MNHLLIGDGHYNGAPGEGDRLGALLEAARVRGLGEVSILGDFFELWIGLSSLEKSWQDALLAPLVGLKQGGVRLRYVVGNRDYFVAEWNHRHRLFDEVVEGDVGVASSQGLLRLAHGDQVNSEDRPYRRWRAFSRSRPVAMLARGLPGFALEKIAARVSKDLSATNRFHKSYFPESELRARARELPSGSATLVFGHFHVHRELSEGDKRILTLPFLGGENAGILVTAQGFERIAG